MLVVEIVNVSAIAVPFWKRATPTKFRSGVGRTGTFVDSSVGNRVSMKDTTVGLVMGGSVMFGAVGWPSDNMPMTMGPQIQRASAPAAIVKMRFHTRFKVAAFAYEQIRALRARHEVFRPAAVPAVYDPPAACLDFTA